MKRAPLVVGGPEFSAVALGTWKLRGAKDMSSAAAVAKLLRAGLECGITTIDTAEIYGDYQMEELLGAALKMDEGLRGQVEIVTKAGIYVPNGFHPERRVAFYNSSAERLVKSAEKSLRFLGVEVIDLFLVHRPDWLTAPEETAAGLDRLVSEGKARSVGVSNYTPSQWRALSGYVKAGLTTNQVEFSPLSSEGMRDGTLDLCMEAGVRPMAWSPLGQGRLFGEGAEALRFREMAAQLGERYAGATVDQLALAWGMAHPSRPLPILGTTRPERLRAAAVAAELVLSREDWYLMTQAVRGNPVP